MPLGVVLHRVGHPITSNANFEYLPLLPTHFTPPILYRIQSQCTELHAEDLGTARALPEARKLTTLRELNEMERSPQKLESPTASPTRTACNTLAMSILANIDDKGDSAHCTGC